MSAKQHRSINARLRELRHQTQPPLSLQDMCDALGLKSREAYGYYEYQGGFRGTRLPEGLAHRIAAVFGRRGIDPAEVLLLAGITGDEPKPAALRLSPSERRMLAGYRELNARCRRRVDKLVDMLLREQANGSQDEPIDG